MKKKIFSLLLVLCLAVPALLLGGCEKDLTIQEYTDYSKNALTNTYNHVLTDKNDLSTQKDFKMTATTVTKRYDETGKLVETTTIIETQERKGQGVAFRLGAVSRSLGGRPCAVRRARLKK